MTGDITGLQAPRRDRLLLGWIIVACALAVVGWVVASPFLAVDSIERQASRQDLAGMAEHVDFASLNRSVSSQLDPVSSLYAGATQDDGVLDRLRRWLAGGAQQWILEAIVSPQGISALLGGHGRWTLARVFRDRALLTAGWHVQRAHVPDTTTWRFVSSRKVVITVPDRDDPSRSAIFILERRGWSWCLVDIRVGQLLPLLG